MKRRQFFASLAALVGAFGLRLKAAPTRKVRPFAGKALRYYRYMVESNKAQVGLIVASYEFRDALLADFRDERLMVNSMMLSSGQNAIAPVDSKVPVVADRRLVGMTAHWADILVRV